MTMVQRFAIRAEAGPQTLARLVNYVAQLGLVPRRVRACQTAGAMHVVIEQEDLADEQAGIIAEKMRASVLVHAVELTRAGPAPVPASLSERARVFPAQ